ncbi:MAG: hypothetical protein QOK10_2032, partial [Pseudonocardiales bacterium]|nr:hypothetical protein [Pseudonocardiales bacterium]
QYETKTGLAATSFGGTLRVPEALRLADEALIAWTVHGSTGRILAHGDTRRIATAPQTRALITATKAAASLGCVNDLGQLTQPTTNMRGGGGAANPVEVRLAQRPQPGWRSESRRSPVSH